MIKSKVTIANTETTMKSFKNLLKLQSKMTNLLESQDNNKKIRMCHQISINDLSNNCICFKNTSVYLYFNQSNLK